VYLRDILPGLEGVTLSRIMEACGVAKSTASAIRSGTRVPKERHWEALSRLRRYEISKDQLMSLGLLASHWRSASPSRRLLTYLLRSNFTFRTTESNILARVSSVL
jgi:hypothetical protein